MAARRVLDVRSAAAFAAGHLPGAVNIPYALLPNRLYELPARGVPFDVVADADVPEAELRAFFVDQHRYTLAEVVRPGADAATERGPQPAARLWRPNEVLERHVERVERLLPERRRAVDIACGSSRDGVFLALRGWSVVAIDYLPGLLEAAQALAATHGCAAAVETRAMDIEASDQQDEVRRLVGGADLVHVARYLHRPLLETIRDCARPGAVLVYHTFLAGAAAFGRPKNPKHLLQDGELARVFGGPRWQVVVDEELALPDGRPINGFVAQKKGSMAAEPE